MLDRITDLVFLIALLTCFIVCYHRLSLLSNRIDMIIMVQQSQQQSLNRCLERDSDLLFKLGKIEKELENK